MNRGWIEREAIVTEIWRRGWDLNPRYPLRYVRFRGGSFQPLTHLSAWETNDYRWQCSRQNSTKLNGSSRLLQSPNACQDGNSPLLAAAFPALAEERLQKFCAPACQHSPPHLHPVIRLRVI